MSVSFEDQRINIERKDGSPVGRYVGEGEKEQSGNTDDRSMQLQLGGIAKLLISPPMRVRMLVLRIRELTLRGKTKV